MAKKQRPGNAKRGSAGDPADKHVPENFSRDEAAAADRATAWPRRNAAGRILTLRHLLEVVTVLLVTGALAVVLVDAVSTWVGFGEFGQTSGWLGGVMAFWLYVEEFRAWKGVPRRWVLALVGGLLAMAVGAGAGFLFFFLPPLLSGVIGVAVAAFGYAPLWFFGIRRLAGMPAA
ncbi:MAG: hypothetical protein ACRDT8_08275 [Micromonosporaceae bacterium]